MGVDALVERLAPGARVVRCVRLQGGVSAEVQAVTFVSSDGIEQRVVVRRHREVEGKAAASARAEREHALLGVLHQRGVAVPRPRLFVAPDTLVQDFVEGSTALPAAPAEAMARALAAIHAIEVDALPALPACDDPRGALREWLAEPSGVDVAEPSGVDEVRAGVDEMRAGVDEVVARSGLYEGPAVLLHGDFWPGNVMWLRGEIAAVLDWEDAAVGDPMSDLACARVELACATGVDVAEAFTEAYRAIQNVDERRLSLWDVYVSTAALRYMDRWGLEPAVLEARRRMTRWWQARALRG